MNPGIMKNPVRWLGRTWRLWWWWWWWWIIYDDWKWLIKKIYLIMDFWIDKTVQMVQSSHNGYKTVQILLLIEYIIFKLKRNKLSYLLRAQYQHSEIFIYLLNISCPNDRTVKWKDVQIGSDEDDQTDQNDRFEFVFQKFWKSDPTMVIRCDLMVCSQSPFSIPGISQASLYITIHNFATLLTPEVRGVISTFSWGWPKFF